MRPRNAGKSNNNNNMLLQQCRSTELSVLWSAVVPILLWTYASCRLVFVYYMCDLGLQSM